jgi:PilZ domain
MIQECCIVPIKGSTLFLQFPSETARRILHPSNVTETSGTDNLTILPEDPELGLEAEMELLIYFEWKQQFMQQPARVEALLEGENGTVATLKTVGEPVSAESRQCYRVSTVMSDLTVTFGQESNCLLRDVSVTGFAVTATAEYQIGQVVDVELIFEGKRFQGKASIQSISPTPDGLIRYGTNCVKAGNTAGSISKGVQLISMAVQRQQLNRLSGGA